MVSDYRGKNKFHFGLRNALNGLKVAILTERNIKIHVIAIVAVVIFGLYVNITNIEWAILSLTMGAVLSMEMMNTAIEKALDHLEPNHHPLIGMAKDMAAGAVFVTAIVSIAVACFIFLSRII